MGEVEQFIRNYAKSIGIDENQAMRVVMSEGGGQSLIDPFRMSLVPVGGGKTEDSVGPFQLYFGGGLGNAAMKQGIDARKDWKGGVKFALDTAKQHGWGDWHGWKGDPWAGIRDRGVAGASAPAGDVGGLGRGAIMSAQQRGSAGAGAGGATGGDGGGGFVSPPVAAADKPQNALEAAGGAFGELGKAFGDQRGVPIPQQVPAEWMQAAGNMPSVYRQNLMPTSVSAGTGSMGGGDMRQLLAMLMQQTGGIA